MNNLLLKWVLRLINLREDYAGGFGQDQGLLLLIKYSPVPEFIDYTLGLLVV